MTDYARMFLNGIASPFLADRSKRVAAARSSGREKK
jgi:hypothetical protein